MEKNDIRRTQVWSGALRLIHWSMAITVLLALATGWQMSNSDCSNLEPLLVIHTIAGFILALALASRVYLLFFGSGPERWQDFIPRGPQLKVAHDVLLFYLTAGRRELPPYYAHNPLWGTTYLFVFLILTVEAITGLMLYLGSNSGFYGYSLATLHQVGHVFLAVFSLLHITAVFLHDLKGTSCEISAMVSGSKIFIAYKPRLDVSAIMTRFPIKMVNKRD
jgi:Ni/Fe-hydrogenase 1 B-type cytochrome subunit